MNFTKIFLFSFLFLGCHCPLFAQGIFVPWKGEREILKLSDENNKISAVNREPCGEYFMYEEIQDQKILHFKILATKGDARHAPAPYQSIGQQVATIRKEISLKSPTVEYVFESETNVYVKPKFIIRISKKDYKISECLKNFIIYKK